MLGELRKPLLVIAVALMLLAFLVEIAMNVVGDARPPSIGQILSAADLDDPEDSKAARKILEGGKGPSGSPPGIGISYMALLDVLLAYSVAVLAVALVVSDAVLGRVLGIVTLIVSLLVIIGAIALVFIALGKLLLMIGLFLAPPFGTIAYLAKWGFFATTQAAVMLSSIMSLKLGCAVCLVLAHQRFLQNKGLVLLILTSLLANIVLGFLHGIVPVILVSITDALGAIIMAILAIVWGLILLVRSIPSVVRAIA